MKTFMAGIFLAILLVSVPVFAHHGSASFDVGKKLELKGTVTEWIWTNPHCWLKFDVRDASGNTVNWVAETSNAADMIERLTLYMNRVRQASITKEIIEVVSGAAAAG